MFKPKEKILRDKRQRECQQLFGIEILQNISKKYTRMAYLTNFIERHLNFGRKLETIA